MHAITKRHASAEWIKITTLSNKELKTVGHQISFPDNVQLVDVFVDLVHCHGNWYDVTSTLEVI